MKKLWVRVAVAMVGAALSWGGGPARARAADSGAEDLKMMRQELAKQRAYVEQLEKRLGKL